jgi:hypothetical protein
MINICTEKQLEDIDFYFRKTTEPYDNWDFDGEYLILLLDNQVIEKYNWQDLSEMITNLEMP